MFSSHEGANKAIFIIYCQVTIVMNGGIVGLVVRAVAFHHCGPSSIPASLI